MTAPKRGTDWPDDVRTLGVDVGGSGLKAAVLAVDGTMLSDRVRADTPYPCPPGRLVEALLELVDGLPEYQRVTVGFPGLVRRGRVRNIPSLSRQSYNGDDDPDLIAAWRDFPLADELGTAFGVPTKVGNDADVQGCAVVSGLGFEFVMTLGTGVGTALFSDGVLVPHLEAGHAPFRKGQTFEQQLSNAARKDVGNERWALRVVRAIAAYDRFLFCDRIYVGGGNAKNLDPMALPAKVEIVPNTAGITGGVRLWDMDYA